MFSCNEVLGRVSWRGRRVPLSLFQVHFVCYLARNAGRAVSHEELHQHFYAGLAIGNPLNGGIAAHNRGVISKINRAFRRIDKSFSCIVTAGPRSLGYIWLAPEEGEALLPRRAA